MTNRKATADRKIEIADAALRVIGERGVKALTAATLAAEVGVTDGALYRHFASLAEILEAAVDRAVARVEETFPPADLDPVERLRRLGAARVALIRSAPGLAWLLLSDQVYLTVPEAAVARLRGLVEKSRAFLSAAIHEGVAYGRLRDDVPPAVILTLFTGAVHALAGSTGVHRAATDASRGPEPEAVFETLFDLLRNQNRRMK
jgi:AcrR family transcriptional regulator